ncbi:MAG: YeeE/YedE family protein [Anderseniella sp.]
MELTSGIIGAMGGFAGGMLLGFAARWGRFCTLGAIEDAALGGNRGRLSAWGLAIAIAITGTFLLDQTGLIDISRSFYLISPTTLLATVFGSTLFGLGMSLVGTCGYGTLARVGGGDLKSVVTFLVLGITAYATMNGLSAYLRIFLFDVPVELDTPASFAYLGKDLFGGSIHLWAYAIATVIAFIALTSRDLRSSRRYLVAGLAVGMAIVSGWFVTGYLANDDFDPHRLESFTFTGPPGDTLVYVMTATGSSLQFGIGAVAGVIFGSTVTTLCQGYFRWEACDDAREMRRQILGGALMGFGGVTALGCTVGQGLSAASTLAFTAPVALASMFIGAWLGLQVLIRGSLRDVWEQFKEAVQQHTPQSK